MIFEKVGGVALLEIGFESLLVCFVPVVEDGKYSVSCLGCLSAAMISCHDELLPLGNFKPKQTPSTSPF